MTGRSTKNRTVGARAALRPAFPFAAITGQEEMKLALLLNAIAPAIGGVLIMGHRGTGKSTAVRALADLLPPLERVRGCRYNCDPSDTTELCDDCCARRVAEGKLVRERAAVPVVDLPLGATEDRVCGTIDIERALRKGVTSFEPGLLARANRGFLYIDEVNLLEDHLVDLLLDVAATGRNVVEREGVSAAHPARFVLVGSGNPEEGELRPQLLDRFGLSAEIRTSQDLDERVQIVERRESFERDPAAFLKSIEPEQTRLRRRIMRARSRVDNVDIPRSLLRLIAELCVRLKIDGHRGEITIARAARALAAFEGRQQASNEDVSRVAAMALRHRMRRDPLEQMTGGTQLDESIRELVGAGDPGAEQAFDSGAPQKNQTAAATDNGGVNGASSESIRNEAKNENVGRGLNPRGDGHSAPPASAHLPGDALALKSSAAKTSAVRGELPPRSRARQTRVSLDASRGRYTRASASKAGGARVALDATLRTAAARQCGRRGHEIAPACALQIAADDLRFKRRRRKAGTLYILAIDCSGSMAANRIRQAKGAVAHLLRECYVKRDRIALVSFREQHAQLLLAPSASAARAKLLLDALPVGGATPLAAGLARALEVAQRGRRAGAPRIVFVIFTDGRANVARAGVAGEERAALRRRIKAEVERCGAALQREGVAALVVDTEHRFTSTAEGQFLSQALGGRYVHLPPGATERVMSEVLS